MSPSPGSCLTHLGSKCPFAAFSELVFSSHGHQASASVVKAVSIEFENVLVEAWKLKKEVREQKSCCEGCQLRKVGLGTAKTHSCVAVTLRNQPSG